MNKKTRAKISASLEEAMKPPGGKEFIPLPKDSNLTRRELMDMLLENYSDAKPVNRSKQKVEKRKAGERPFKREGDTEQPKTELPETERPSKRLFDEAIKQIKGEETSQIVIVNTRTPRKKIPSSLDISNKKFVHPIEEMSDSLNVYNVFGEIRVSINNLSHEITGEYLNREQMPELLELVKLLETEIRQAATKQSEPIENLPSFALEYFKRKLADN